MSRPDWMPKNPCKDCTLEEKRRFSFAGCQGDWDCKFYGRYRCSVDALKNFMKHLLNTPTCRDGMHHYCPNCDHAIMGDNEHKIKDMLKLLDEEGQLE